LNHAPVRTVHVGHFDFGIFPVPVAPEDAALRRVEGEAPEVDEVIGEQHLAPLRLVEAGDGYVIQCRVGPENVARHPVDGQTLGRLDFRAAEATAVGAVVLGAADRLAVHVAPVHAALLTVNVNS
jgi:hypothetical protein